MTRPTPTFRPLRTPLGAIAIAIAITGGAAGVAAAIPPTPGVGPGRVEGMARGARADGPQRSASVADATFGRQPDTTFGAATARPTPALELAAVPESQSWALIVGGLGAMAWVARRRRADR